MSCKQPRRGERLLAGGVSPRTEVSKTPSPDGAADQFNLPPRRGFASCTVLSRRLTPTANSLTSLRDYSIHTTSPTVFIGIYLPHSSNYTPHPQAALEGATHFQLTIVSTLQRAPVAFLAVSIAAGFFNQTNPRPGPMRYNITDHAIIDQGS